MNLKFIKNLTKGLSKTFKKKAKEKPSKENNSNDIYTSRKNLDFRGVFSLRPLNNGDRLRNAEFTLRLCGLVIGGLLIIAILETMLIVIIGQRKVEPMFLSVKGKDEQIYRVEPLEKTTKDFSIVTESIIYQYVESRESIDFQTDKERWGFVKWLSASDVYQDFLDEFGPNNQKEDAPWQRAKLYNLARGVKIIGIDNLKGNLFQVDFQVLEYNRSTGKIVTKADMRATLTIKYEPKKVSVKDEYMNPLGLKIIDYSLATRNLQQFAPLIRKKPAKTQTAEAKHD